MRKSTWIYTGQEPSLLLLRIYQSGIQDTLLITHFSMITHIFFKANSMFNVQRYCKLFKKKIELTL